MLACLRAALTWQRSEISSGCKPSGLSVTSSLYHRSQSLKDSEGEGLQSLLLLPCPARVRFIFFSSGAGSAS